MSNVIFEENAAVKSVIIEVASIRWDEKATIAVGSDGNIIETSDYNTFRGKLTASEFSPDHKRWVARFGEGGFSVATFVSEEIGRLLAGILESQKSTKEGRARNYKIEQEHAAGERAVYETIRTGRAKKV